MADANKATELDLSMSIAYLRKATACMKLEEYQTAKAVLETGAALAPGESRFSKLIKECEERIAKTVDLPKQTLEEVTTNVVPPIEIDPDKLPNPVTVVAPPKPTLTYRHEFFQKPEELKAL